MAKNKSEKIMIDINVVDLGYIDLLVEEGFYSDRIDLVKTAIDNQLKIHSSITKDIVTKKRFAVGMVTITKGQLMECIANNEKLYIKVIGYIHIAKDIPMDIIRRAIESITIMGVIKCSDEVKKYYGL